MLVLLVLREEPAPASTTPLEQIHLARLRIARLEESPIPGDDTEQEIKATAFLSLQDAVNV